MNSLRFKKNIHENNLRIKKTISLIGKSVQSDWIILISSLFIILIIGLVFSFFTYKNIKSESFLEGSEIVQTNSLNINTEQLDRVINRLNQKKETFDLF
jgi:LPS O-antigen subunit length determinant protein (WzzB/FepE family)